MTRTRYRLVRVAIVGTDATHRREKSANGTVYVSDNRRGEYDANGHWYREPLFTTRRERVEIDTDDETEDGAHPPSEK